MAETSNIAQMAEKVSKEIFSEFFWDKVGSIDTNWNCCQQKKHNKTTHPTDIVFRYEDPYEQKYINVNYDLKSYAKGSINTTTIRMEKSRRKFNYANMGNCSFPTMVGIKD